MKATGSEGRGSRPDIAVTYLEVEEIRRRRKDEGGPLGSMGVLDVFQVDSLTRWPSRSK